MLKIDGGSKSIFKSVNYRVVTPTGQMFVNILEDDNDKICGLEITIGKAGSDLKAWTHSFARLLTLSLDMGATLEQLIAELSSQTSDKSRTTDGGVKIRSGVEGVYRALMLYRNDKHVELRKEMKLDGEDYGEKNRRTRVRSR